MFFRLRKFPLNLPRNSTIWFKILDSVKKRFASLIHKFQLNFCIWYYVDLCFMNIKYFLVQIKQRQKCVHATFAISILYVQLHMCTNANDRDIFDGLFMEIRLLLSHFHLNPILNKLSPLMLSN